MFFSQEFPRDRTRLASDAPVRPVSTTCSSLLHLTQPRHLRALFKLKSNVTLIFLSDQAAKRESRKNLSSDTDAGGDRTLRRLTLSAFLLSFPSLPVSTLDLQPLPTSNTLLQVFKQHHGVLQPCQQPPASVRRASSTDVDERVGWGSSGFPGQFFPFLLRLLDRFGVVEV